MKTPMASLYAIGLFFAFVSLCPAAADELIQRKITPAQIRTLETKLAKLPKRDISIYYWLGSSGPRYSYSFWPNPGALPATADKNPTAKRQGNETDEVLTLVEQLDRILTKCGYRVKVDMAAGSGPGTDVQIDYGVSSAQAAIALEHALKQSNVTSEAENDDSDTMPIVNPLRIFVGLERSSRVAN